MSARAGGEASAQQHLWQSRGRRRPRTRCLGRRRRRGARSGPACGSVAPRPPRRLCRWRLWHTLTALGLGRRRHQHRRPAAGRRRCGGGAAGDAPSGARRSDFTGDCSHLGRARSYSKRAHSHSALSPAPESAARGRPAPESAARTCWRTDAPCPEGQGRAGAAGLRRLA